MFRQRYQDGPITTQAQQMARALYSHGLSDQSIAGMVCCTREHVNRIRHGRESGRNLEQRLRRVCETLAANKRDAGFSDSSHGPA